jgi:hypothetical protein
VAPRSSPSLESRPFDGRREFSRGVAVPRSGVAVVEPRFVRPGYYRPYFSFRPRYTFSFGLVIGYPVAYPYWYDPYLPGVYRYYRPGFDYGGVTFDVEPLDAAIYVDGEYVGAVADFAPWRAPLTLIAGRHHVELVAADYAPIGFDLTVLPHQVIPYQGTLGYRE